MKDAGYVLKDESCRVGFIDKTPKFPYKVSAVINPTQGWGCWTVEPHSSGPSSSIGSFLTRVGPVGSLREWLAGGSPNYEERLIQA
jgi:hypothetical protein